MKIREIYDKFQILLELRQHMIRTAAVAENLCDHWTGPKVDREEIVIAMLLHDMGNMAKVRPEINLYDHTSEEIKRQIEQKKRFTAKYGTNDYLANEKIARELGVSTRVYFLIENLGFKKNYQTVMSKDYSLRICAYSDQRVGPFGFVTLPERMAEAKKRYNGVFLNPGGHSSEELVADAFKNEKEVLGFTKFDLTDQDVDFEKFYEQDIAF